MSNNFQVNTNEYLSQCDSKDVISFKSEKWASINKLKDIIYQYLINRGIDQIVNYISQNHDLRNSKEWFYEGEECEILKAGSKGWQKGKLKIRVSLEFIPDEPEEAASPLDDIRQADRNNPAQP